MPGKTVSRARALAGHLAAKGVLYAYCLELVLRDSAGALAWFLWFESRPLHRAPGASRWRLTARERALLNALWDIARKQVRR